MSGGLPLIGGYNNANLAYAGGTFVSLTTAVSNTQGAWNTIVSSTPYDAGLMIVVLDYPANGAYQGAVSIAIGGAGSERPIINNLVIAFGNYAMLQLPISVPAGTRISGALTSFSGGDICYANIVLLDASFTAAEGIAGIDTYGFITTTSQGTVLTTIGAATWTSYTQLAASTTRDYVAFIIGTDAGQNYYISYGYMELEIAIGASGSEQIIYHTFIVSAQTIIIPIAITSGTRVSVRVLNNGSGNTIGVMFYGLYK